jgi:hypothetical protein
LTEHTREAVDAHIKAAGKKPGQFLFVGHRGPDRAISTRQYARLVSQWVAGIGLDPSVFGTHSLTANESDPHLSADRKSAGRSTTSWASEDREHGPVSWDRGG